MNIVTAVQARTSSTRLPNKVLLPLCGKPLLLRMIERIQLAKSAGTIVVVTSWEMSDDIIEILCKNNGIECFRGSFNDLLDRHYQMSLKYNADAIVKIPSDRPLIDPFIIDQTIGCYIDHYPKYDYVSNLHPATYPDGNDVEIMLFETLAIAWNEAKADYECEHTTPFIWENPKRFSIKNVVWETGLDFSTTFRWTIDYKEDYQFIKNVYDELYPNNSSFGLYNILNLIEKKPGLKQINSKYAGEYWYLNHLDKLKTINDYKLKLAENGTRISSFE